MEMSEGVAKARPARRGGALGAVLAGLVVTLVAVAAVGVAGGRELVLVPLVVLPGAVAGVLRRRDGLAVGLVAGLLTLALALLVLLLLRDSHEPRSVLEYLAAWAYPGLGIVLGNALAGTLGGLLREECANPAPAP